ncbi:hypothetical protein RND71_008084 [Anisodus tanguticus]|uniref:DNA-directed DNA polymerase n=1 Tax=Anisodus tanguticus TaxID=243964 RepID=A0AAE1VU07_9SOLA|nr:hypothetical protein RND71_008084 [Anisodus tanguticus]
MDLNPPPLGAEVRLLSLTVVHMLYLHAYPSLPSSGYAKFTIGFDLEKPDITVTAGHAIWLYGDDEEVIRLVFPKNDSLPIRADEIRHCKRSYAPHYMTAVKKGERKGNRRAFIIADLETLITGEENTHKPYAAGLMLILPKEPVKYNRVETYFSEDYIAINSFDERSSKVLEDFLSRIEHIAKGFRPALTIDFHNLGRFDGVFLLKHRRLIGRYEGELLDYLRKDVLLLGGVIQKAQKRIWDQHKVNIEKELSLPALALHLFHQKFYEPDKWPIYIPNPNEDRFMREGYYSGHVDTYIPVGSPPSQLKAQWLLVFNLAKLCKPSTSLLALYIFHSVQELRAIEVLSQGMGLKASGHISRLRGNAFFGPIPIRLSLS